MLAHAPISSQGEIMQLSSLTTIVADLGLTLHPKGSGLGKH